MRRSTERSFTRRGNAVSTEFHSKFCCCCGLGSQSRRRIAKPVAERADRRRTGQTRKFLPLLHNGTERVRYGILRRYISPPRHRAKRTPPTMHSGDKVSRVSGMRADAPFDAYGEVRSRARAHIGVNNHAKRNSFLREAPRPQDVYLAANSARKTTLQFLVSIRWQKTYARTNDVTYRLQHMRNLARK